MSAELLEVWSGVASRPRIHLYRANDSFRGTLCGTPLSGRTDRIGPRGSWHPEYAKPCERCLRKAEKVVSA